MVVARWRTAFVAITWIVICAEPTIAQTLAAPAVDSLEATGAFAPSGPPSGAPRRVDAGGACVVDVRQGYGVSGTLGGTFEVDFRILVHGPCGSPAGTFDEEWIAVGRFSGVVAAEQVSSGFTYTASVREDGEIRGTIRFGPELDGEVAVSGRFSDGRLAYAGWIEE
jgi:hypothetical protein